ncbi:glutaredoxin family protein, partial [Stenotrophomonas maltophilia]|uniref:glutaredoxin family protein n=1 Tax=Stenotrophomonas maltophilia TaxID=40324 RepID=UPI0039C36A10
MLTLFQRDDCHLCDMALAELAKARAPEFESVFLDDQPALEARYGARVPVLRDETGGRELDWPFDAASDLGKRATQDFDKIVSLFVAARA